MDFADEDFQEQKKKKKRINVFYVAAIILGVHGLFFGFFIYVLLPYLIDFISGFTQKVFFWAFSAPALYLTYPFEGLLWKIGLLDEPGFKTWPKPAGFVISYLIWIAVFVLLGLISWLIRPKHKKLR